MGQEGSQLYQEGRDARADGLPETHGRDDWLAGWRDRDLDERWDLAVDLDLGRKEAARPAGAAEAAWEGGASA
jgi:hypothetical protein